MANTDTDLRCYLTNAGIAAENNAIQLGRKLPIKEMVFGSGVLADSEDPRHQTTMISEQFKVPCAMITHGDNTTLLTFKGDIPVDVGGFNINEVAIRLEDGTIYGYARGAGDYKPTPEQGATESIRYVVDMYSTNVTVIECKVDLSNVYADYEDLELLREESSNALSEHKNESNPHVQYSQIKHLVGLIGQFHLPGNKAGWVDLKGGELSRTTDLLLWEYAKSASMVVTQSVKDADPISYAMKFGDGDGTTTFTLPNHHLGHFVRGHQSDVPHGTTQSDAIRNIVGSVMWTAANFRWSGYAGGSMDGAFYGTKKATGDLSDPADGAAGGSIRHHDTFNLDASRVVPTAKENRPLTANLTIKIHRGWM